MTLLFFFFWKLILFTFVLIYTFLLHLRFCWFFLYRFLLFNSYFIWFLKFKGCEQPVYEFTVSAFSLGWPCARQSIAKSHSRLQSNLHVLHTITGKLRFFFSLFLHFYYLFSAPYTSDCHYSECKSIYVIVDGKFKAKKKTTTTTTK